MVVIIIAGLGPQQRRERGDRRAGGSSGGERGVQNLEGGKLGKGVGIAYGPPLSLPA